MKPMTGLLLFLLLALGGATWAVIWGPLRGVIPLPQTSAQTAQAPAAAEKPAQVPPAPVARQQSASPRKEEVAPTAAEVAPPAPPAKRFPTAVDVPLGTLGSAIIADFGPPTARTISVDKGDQIETLIYRRTLPDTATVIQLRNGRVVSGNSTAY
jgi:uncharacterized iron-regulated membrane protein